MASTLADQKAFHTRLDTWKSIAQHLGRSSRTVQRWHIEYGLPVYHLSGDAGSVYAYADELDEWLRTRGRPQPSAPAPENILTLRAAETHAGEPVTGSSQTHLVSRESRRRAAQLVGLAEKGWEAFSHRNITAILNFYRESLELDPENAHAYAGLALGLVAQGLSGIVKPAMAYAAAQAACENAMRLAPQLPLARAAGAWIKLVTTRDWEGARIILDELSSSAPASPRILNGRAMLHIAEGRPERASELFLRSAQLHPLSSAAHSFYCWSRYLARDYEHALHRIAEVRATGGGTSILDAVEALVLIQIEGDGLRMGRLESLAADPAAHPVVQGTLGYMYSLNNEPERATHLLKTMTDRAHRRSGYEPYAQALLHLGLNEKDQAIASLEQSFRDGSLWSLGFRLDPLLKSLRTDSKCSILFEKMNFPEPLQEDIRIKIDEGSGN